MPVIALPLDPDAPARALLHHLLEAGDVIGRDDAGRTVIQLAVGDLLLDQCSPSMAAPRTSRTAAMTSRTNAKVLSFDLAPPRQLYRRRQYPGRR